MLMNNLLQTRIFGLLSETSQEVTNQEMQNAYDEFIEHIKNVSNGTDYSVIHRTLNATRIEIASLETTPLYGQGGKMPSKSCFCKRHWLLSILNWNY